MNASSYFDEDALGDSTSGACWGMCLPCVSRRVGHVGEVRDRDGLGPTQRAQPVRIFWRVKVDRPGRENDCGNDWQRYVLERWVALFEGGVLCG